jgi:Phage-related minor tail protein
MVDKVSTFQISFSGDAGDLNSVLSALKGSVRTAVSEIQGIASKVTLFDDLEASVQKAALAFDAAKASAAELKIQVDFIKGSGGTIGQDLAAQLKLAENAANSASKAYNAQVTQLSALQTKLSAAGVNTGALASEQLRLADALKVATLAAAQQSAKGLLGFTGVSDVQPQVTALTKAFDTLRLSGKLSASEIAAAQSLLNEKIIAVRATVSTATSTFKQQATEVGSFFASVQSKILGAVVVVGSVVAAFKSVTDEAKAFNQGIAQIGAITTLSKEQLATLGEEARTLARTIGIDVVDAVKQLGVIVGTGIPADNAIAVLAASAETAKIAQIDLGTAVKLSTTLVNAFGVQADDLNRVLAIFFQSSKNGGPSLTALSEDLGKLGPIAKQTNTPIEEISAALQVMVKAGVPASNAITDLNLIINKLKTEPARKELAALGITTTDLVEKLTQIGKTGIPVEQIIGDLGLSSARSVAGITALTDGSDKLTKALTAQAGALDAAAKAQAALADTAEEREKRLKAAFQDTAITLGGAIGTGSKYADMLATLLNKYNALAPATRDSIAQQGLLTTIFGALAPAALLLVAAYDRLTSSQTAAAAAAIKVAAAAAESAVKLRTTVAAIQTAVTDQAAAAAAAVKEARASLTGFVADLQTQITASQAATAAAITDLNARAAAQIAALDKSTAAEKATAVATLAIHTKLAADRLTLIVKNNTDILAAVNAAGAAQLAAVAGSAEKTKAVDLSVAQAKLAALGLYKGQLAAALADAVAQEQGYVGKLNTIDAARVTFNRDVQDKLTSIRNEGLSDFDAYIVKTGQINKLLADAQTAFQQGGEKGLALGKTLTDQAIALTGTLKTVVNENGVAVISALDLQQTKLGLITKAADQYNKALDGQEAAAIAGKDASVAAIDAVKPKLEDITKQYDVLAKTVAEGLAIKIKIDEDAIATAQKTIDEAVEKERLIKVKLDDLGVVQTQIDALVANLKTGVTEGTDAQLQGISTTLQKIAKEAPELQLKVTDALTQVDSVKTAVDKIADLKPKFTVDSNVAEVQTGIDHLKLPTESTHTIHVVTVNDSGGAAPAPGGSGGTEDTTPAPGGDGGGSGFAHGGIVGSLRRTIAPARTAWQAFAGGGFAFPRMAGVKVPGVGNEDTFPALLQRGSFVMKKAASQLYGDATMMRIAMGELFGVRKFAIGGIATDILGGMDASGNNIAQKILAGGLPALPGDHSVGNLGTPPDPALRAAIIQAVETIGPLAEEAARLPQSIGDQNLGDYLAAVLALIEQAPNATAAHALLDPLVAIMSTIRGMIDYARRLHIPVVSGVVGAILNETPLNAPKAPIAALPPTKKAAGGAAGSDTVNALLTPGEFVVSAPAVNALGSDFLHLLNKMQVSRGDLEAFMRFEPPRPQRFADGGMVGNPEAGHPSWRQPDQGSGKGNLTVNVNGAGLGDIFSVDNLRRYFLPNYNTIIRRGK